MIEFKRAPGRTRYVVRLRENCRICATGPDLHTLGEVVHIASGWCFKLDLFDTTVQKGGFRTRLEAGLALFYCWQRGSVPLDSRIELVDGTEW